MKKQKESAGVKSAYELAMEKLRKKDSEQGVESAPLTDAQKEEIAEIRSFYRAKLAEREILFQSEIRKARATGEAELVTSTEDGYRRDRRVLESEMEEKLRAARSRRAKSCSSIRRCFLRPRSATDRLAVLPDSTEMSDASRHCLPR